MRTVLLLLGLVGVAVSDQRPYVKTVPPTGPTPPAIVVLADTPNEVLVCADVPRGTVSCRSVEAFRLWVRERVK